MLECLINNLSYICCHRNERITLLTLKHRLFNSREADQKPSFLEIFVWIIPVCCWISSKSCVTSAGGPWRNAHFWPICWCQICQGFFVCYLKASQEGSMCHQCWIQNRLLHTKQQTCHPLWCMSTCYKATSSQLKHRGLQALFYADSHQTSVCTELLAPLALASASQSVLKQNNGKCSFCSERFCNFACLSNICLMCVGQWMLNILLQNMIT